MEQSEIYRRLAEKLSFNTFLPEGGPKLLEILNIMFTPEEAELALDLPFLVTDAEEIANSLGKKADELIPQLERMADKGLLYAGEKEGRKRYQLLVLFPGMIELQFMGDKPPASGPKQAHLARVFEDFYRQIMERQRSMSEQRSGEEKRSSGLRTAYSRVIPVSLNIQAKSEIQPYEVVSNYIQDSKDMAIGNCYCRTVKGILGQACSAPVDVCMVFGPFARFTAERGFARRADRSQMLEALDRAEEAGLVHISDNIQDKINFICNCCGCCCGFLQGITRYRIPNAVAASRFLAVIDSESCTGCEACIDHCQAKAIQSEGEKVGIDSQWCIGCGLCVSACPEDAISLTERNDYRPPLEDINKLRMTVFREVSGQEE